MARIFLFLSPRSISLFEKSQISFRNLFLNYFKSLDLNLNIQNNFEKFQI
jgi:hypothetical protein